MYEQATPIYNNNTYVNPNVNSFAQPQNIHNSYNNNPYQLDNNSQSYTPPSHQSQTSNHYKGSKQQNKNTYINYSEMDNVQLINNLETVGRDQTGCRLLQKKIQEDKNFLNNFLYPKVISSLIKDFAKYA